MSAHNGSGPRPGPVIDWSNPFTSVGEILLRDIHDAGRRVFGVEWPRIGPGLVADTSGGRTRSSWELTHDEGLALLRLVENCDGPEVVNPPASKQLRLLEGRNWHRGLS